MAGQFTLDLSKFVEKAKVKPELVIKKVLFDIYTRIVYRTPVDTGRARGGWQVNQTLTSSSPVRLDKGGMGLDAQKINSLKLKDGIIGFIFNNVVYIKRLEDGHSRQARHGMVKLTLVEFQMYIDKAVRSLA